MDHTSDKALAAPIWPNHHGSSTGGVMKSHVLMTAISSVRR